MSDASSNAGWIRLLLIFAVLALPQLLRLLQKPKEKAPPAARPPQTSLSDLLNAMRKSAEQERGIQPPSTQAESFSAPEPVNAPPIVQFESAFLSSLLLVGLFVCLGLLAFQYLVR